MIHKIDQSKTNDGELEDEVEMSNSNDTEIH